MILLQRKEVFYILEVIRGRLRFDDLKRKILKVKRRWGTGTLLIEDSPISRGLIQSLEENSINVTPYTPETDKRSRLIAQSDLFVGGSVRLPKDAPWLEDFTAELLAFPAGRHDDQVDALTQGLAWVGSCGRNGPDLIAERSSDQRCLRASKRNQTASSRPVCQVRYAIHISDITDVRFVPMQKFCTAVEAGASRPPRRRHVLGCCEPSARTKIMRSELITAVDSHTFSEASHFPYRKLKKLFFRC